MRDPPKYLEINSIMRFKYKLIAFKSSLSNCNEFKIESDQFDVTRTVHHIWRHNCIALCSLQKPVSYWDQMNVCCWPHTGWEFAIQNVKKWENECPPIVFDYLLITSIIQLFLLPCTMIDKSSCWSNFISRMHRGIRYSRVMCLIRFKSWFLAVKIFCCPKI